MNVEEIKTGYTFEELYTGKVRIVEDGYYGADNE